MLQPGKPAPAAGATLPCVRQTCSCRLWKTCRCCQPCSRGLQPGQPGGCVTCTCTQLLEEAQDESQQRAEDAELETEGARAQHAAAEIKLGRLTARLGLAESRARDAEARLHCVEERAVEAEGQLSDFEARLEAKACPCSAALACLPAGLAMSCPARGQFTGREAAQLVQPLQAVGQGCSGLCPASHAAPRPCVVQHARGGCECRGQPQAWLPQC